MKRLWFLILLLMTSWLLPGTPFIPVDPEEPACSGFIHITGESNIGDFSLQTKLEDIPVEQSQVQLKGKSIPFYVLSLPLENFEGRNKQMKNDFLELLRAEEFPMILVSFQNCFPVREKTGAQHVQILLTIAGVERNYAMECMIVEEAENRYKIIGEKTILLRDFNLTPPRKLFGMVKLREWITIHFSVTFAFCVE